MTDYRDRTVQRHIRLDFFEEYGAQKALSAVAVRRDAGQGNWFLDVGLTGQAAGLPEVYQGLTVREQQVGRARHAVLLPEQSL